MPDRLYERNILLWSEEQVRQLQRVAPMEAGLNAAVDWANIIKEVESAARSAFKTSESLLVQAVLHLCRLHAWPWGQSNGPWAVSVCASLRSTRRSFNLFMRQRLDIPELSVKAAYLLVDGSGPSQLLPNAPLLTPYELMVKRPDAPALVVQQGAA